MQFTRTYRSKSLSASSAAMGPVWFHSWQRGLGLTNANSGSSSTVLAYRENGEPVTFKWASGSWRSAGFTGLALAQNGSGWTLTDLRSETVESYSFSNWRTARSRVNGESRAMRPGTCLRS
ncbi:hypothetical protein PQR14_36710, partial [Paraburkholderia bryophila]